MVQLATRRAVAFSVALVPSRKLNEMSRREIFDDDSKSCL